MMDPSTRARLDQHLISARAILYRTIAGGTFEIMRDWVRAYSGLQIPTYNNFQPLTAAGLTDDTLADTAAFFFSKETLYTIELIHDRIPEGPDYLDQRYYESLPPQPAMFLRGLPGDVNPCLNPEVTVERITTVPSLTAFCTLLHEVFDFSLSDMIKFFPVRHLDEAIKDSVRHYLAFMDEQPVGAGTVICTENVASIWNVCTIDSYRQRGVASTLLHHMLNEANERGYHLKMLYSTPNAYHLFGKFDFEIYTQRQWFLPPGLDYQDEEV